jgi:hypothetical protein
MKIENKPSKRIQKTASGMSIPWWKQQAQQRPLATAGTVVSTVGGVVLLIFFCQLGSIPELDLAGASAILMSVAAVGIVLSFSLTACALAAGLILRGEDDPFDDMRSSKGIWSLVLPGWLTTLVFSLSVFLAPDEKIPNWAWCLPLALMAFFACIYAISNPESDSPIKGIESGLRLQVGRALSYLLVSGLWTFSAAAALLTFIAIYPRDGLNSNFLIGLVLWATWCYFSNFLLVKIVKAHVMAMIGFCCLGSLLILLAISGNWTGISVAAVRVLGLGEIPVALVLTTEGCDLLNKAGGQTVCRIQAHEKTATVCPAVLRSRIGSPLFIGLSPYDEKGHWPQMHPPARLAAIAIPKKEVLSWTRLEPMKAKAVIGPGNPKQVVTYLTPSTQTSWLYEQCGEAPQIKSNHSSTRKDKSNKQPIPQVTQSLK